MQKHLCHSWSYLVITVMHTLKERIMIVLSFMNCAKTTVVSMEEELMTWSDEFTALQTTCWAKNRGCRTERVMRILTGDYDCAMLAVHCFQFHSYERLTMKKPNGIPRIIAANLHYYQDRCATSYLRAGSTMILRTTAKACDEFVDFRNLLW